MFFCYIVVQVDLYNGQAAAVSTAQVLCASLKTIIKNNHRHIQCRR